MRRLGGQLILCVGRCRVRSQSNHAPGSRSSFLRFLLQNHHYQNRSGGVEETGCMELPFYNDPDGVTYDGGSCAHLSPCSARTSVRCCF